MNMPACMCGRDIRVCNFERFPEFKIFRLLKAFRKKIKHKRMCFQFPVCFKYMNTQHGKHQ